MILRGVLALTLLAVVAYGTFEVRRWFRPATRDLINARQKRLRAWGLFFLLLSLTLYLIGTFFPTPRTKLQMLHMLIFWTATTLCALPLIPLALLDARENLRRLLTARQALAQERIGLARDLYGRIATPASEADHDPAP